MGAMADAAPPPDMLGAEPNDGTSAEDGSDETAMDSAIADFARALGVTVKDPALARQAHADMCRLSKDYGPGEE